MSPEESVRAGNLSQALQDLQQRVRGNPGDVKARIFLYQLLAVLGQWERAATQLKVASDLDPSALILAQIGRQALQAEQLRARVFAGGTTPLLMGEPAGWVALLLEALRLAAEGHYEKAAELRGQALESAPTTSGTINGESFAWLADADSRIGPCLELIIDGKYYWVPFDRLGRIDIEAPAPKVWTVLCGPTLVTQWFAIDARVRPQKGGSWSGTLAPGLTRHAMIDVFDPPGSVYTTPTSINSTGAIAGLYTDSSDLVHGFLRDPDGSIISFDPAGSTYTAAVSINKDAAIAGFWYDSRSDIHGFVRAADGTITTFDVAGAASGDDDLAAPGT